MKKFQEIAVLFVRLSLAGGFLSAVASRLNLWGRHSSGWDNFVAYTGEVNSFLPKTIIPVLAVLTTISETVLALLLLFGYKTRYAALGAGILTTLFTLAMTYSFGIKEALDYSVFAFCSAGFLLATMPYYKWSIDQFFINKKS